VSLTASGSAMADSLAVIIINKITKEERKLNSLECIFFENFIGIKNKGENPTKLSKIQHYMKIYIMNSS
ncbi:MAG: hypothetical protein OSB44_10260, partial [Verrucomicrobiales bacterium]|nr:hypothetical protein [Verrucomicrobiales bacterium]